jgi:hypothetical protein
MWLHCTIEKRKEKKRKPLVLICYLDKLIEHPIISIFFNVGSITHLYTDKGGNSLSLSSFFVILLFFF